MFQDAGTVDILIRFHLPGDFTVNVVMQIYGCIIFQVKNINSDQGGGDWMNRKRDEAFITVRMFRDDAATIRAIQKALIPDKPFLRGMSFSNFVRWMIEEYGPAAALEKS